MPPTFLKERKYAVSYQPELDLLTVDEQIDALDDTPVINPISQSRMSLAAFTGPSCAVDHYDVSVH
jgi:hypothetical protein